MSNVISLEDYRDDPHFVVTYNNRTHVIPVKLLENILDGSIKITDVEDYEELVKGLICIIIDMA